MSCGTGSRSDLDLHVKPPEDEWIYHGNKISGGGELDVDKQASANDPIENVFFTEAQLGRYTVKIRKTSTICDDPISRTDKRRVGR
eukprot:COSAG03_NODE_130_length_12039_cov_8.050180_2_plen_86_part_00